jgi:hypothetical protein
MVSPGVAGKVTFLQNTTRIAGCIGMTVNAANSFTATCNWKPSVRNYAQIFLTFVPTAGAIVRTMHVPQASGAGTRGGLR